MEKFLIIIALPLQSICAGLGKPVSCPDPLAAYADFPVQVFKRKTGGQKPQSVLDFLACIKVPADLKARHVAG